MLSFEERSSRWSLDTFKQGGPNMCSQQFLPWPWQLPSDPWVGGTIDDWCHNWISFCAERRGLDGGHGNRDEIIYSDKKTWRGPLQWSFGGMSSVTLWQNLLRGVEAWGRKASAGWRMASAKTKTHEPLSWRDWGAAPAVGGRKRWALEVRMSGGGPNRAIQQTDSRAAVWKEAKTMMSTTRPQGMIPPRFEEECVRAATSNIFNWKKRNSISYFLYTPPPPHLNRWEPMLWWFHSYMQLLCTYSTEQYKCDLHQHAQWAHRILFLSYLWNKLQCFWEKNDYIVHNILVITRWMQKQCSFTKGAEL